MFKKWASFILVLLMVLSLNTVFADAPQGPEVHNITVTEEGGKYKFDNVELVFKKDCMGEDMQPITFTIAFYAENGVPYIDIEPSVDKFEKDVAIKVEKGTVEMYDVITGDTVSVQLENYNFKVEHFSRYIIMD